MKRDAVALLSEALTLPAKDRAALAEALIASLDDHSDDDAATAWESEIARRIVELDAGVVTPIPWPEVRRRLFDRGRRCAP
jgi:putative addiction module component (TIGR02574 family)